MSHSLTELETRRAAIQSEVAHWSDMRAGSITSTGGRCGNPGWSRAKKKVVLGDGAEWIGNLAQQHFPGAVQIVDLYHARQHRWDLVRKLYPNDEVQQKRWIRVQKRRLDHGKIEKPVLALRSIDTANPGVAEKIRSEADYFEINAERLRYPKFRGQHLFVGSGVIEAGCKTARGQCHPGVALLPPQRPVRGLLGGSPRGVTCTSVFLLTGQS